MVEVADVFLAKAQEALAGAESEFANGRYNNCANRCYYSAFHAAIYALEVAGIRVTADQGTWGYDAIQAGFAGQLVQRRKLYPAELRSVLLRNQALRNTADYERHWVTEIQAAHALRRTRVFVQAVASKGAGS